MQTSQRRPCKSGAQLDCSCQPTNIRVRNAARRSKRSSQCAMSRSANVRKSFAGCQSGGTGRSSVFSARAQVLSSRALASTARIIEANRTRRRPNRNLRRKPPKAVTNRQKRSQRKLLLPASRRKLRRNHQKNRADVLGRAARIDFNTN